MKAVPEAGLGTLVKLWSVKYETQHTNKEKNKWTERGKKKKKKWPINEKCPQFKEHYLKVAKIFAIQCLSAEGKDPEYVRDWGPHFLTSAPQMADLKTGQGLE